MQRLRLLICDDEAKFAEFVARVAEDAGLDVFIVTDADEFEPAVLRFAPTHIVLDLQMPGTDGITLTRRLGEMQSKASLLICSGTDSRILEAAERLAAEVGLRVAGTVPKPVRVAQLRELFEGLAADGRWLTEDSLRAAVARDDLFLAFQPIVSLASGAIEGFEGLLRWQHPQRGLIMPDQFIPFTETNGLMGMLTTRVLELGIAEAASWQAAELPFSVSLNISAADLDEPGFPDRIEDLCVRMGVPTERIRLEITESAAMSDPARAIEIMARLRLKGVRLSIDDFGTGYSSLYQLHRLPFTELKIDRAFVTDCHQSRQSYAIVRSVVGLAASLDVRCLAEGVESAAVLSILEELGCTYAQGYHISRPIRAEQIPAWVKRWQRGRGFTVIDNGEPQEASDGAVEFGS